MFITCQILTSFVFICKSIIYCISFAWLYKSPSLKCSFEQVYHLTGSSLLSELKKIFATCLYCTCWRDFNFLKIMFWQGSEILLGGTGIKGGIKGERNLVTFKKPLEVIEMISRDTEDVGIPNIPQCHHRKHKWVHLSQCCQDEMKPTLLRT